jgi:drug/metabolite transporter (DMT)-like permease
MGDVGLLLGAACFLTLGYTASVITVRIGDLSFSASFRYTVMVFAIILQIVVFGDIPDALTFVGTALIALRFSFA